jgi:hypothetical protein
VVPPLTLLQEYGSGAAVFAAATVLNKTVNASANVIMPAVAFFKIDFINVLP